MVLYILFHDNILESQGSVAHHFTEINDLLAQIYRGDFENFWDF